MTLERFTTEQVRRGQERGDWVRLADVERRYADVEPLIRKMRELRALVNEQAEDAGLWFIAQYASEAELQQALRRLHSAIEDDALLPAEKAGCSCHSGSVCSDACARGLHHDGCGAAEKGAK